MRDFFQIAERRAVARGDAELWLMVVAGWSRYSNSAALRSCYLSSLKILADAKPAYEAGIKQVHETYCNSAKCVCPETGTMVERVAAAITAEVVTQHAEMFQHQLAAAGSDYSTTLDKVRDLKAIAEGTAKLIIADFKSTPSEALAPLRAVGLLPSEGAAASSAPSAPLIAVDPPEPELSRQTFVQSIQSIKGKPS